MRLAAHWGGYKWSEFRKLPANPRWMGIHDEECQAAVLVLYRRDKQLQDMNQSWL